MEKLLNSKQKSTSNKQVTGRMRCRKSIDEGGERKKRELRGEGSGAKTYSI